MKRFAVSSALVALAVVLAWVGCGTDQGLVAPGGDTELGVAGKLVPAGEPVAKLTGLSRAMEVQNLHTERLLAIAGVVGTAIGRGADGQPAVLVLAETPGIRGIPPSLDGVPVVVKVTGKIRALTTPTGRFDRPVPTGVSTGHPDITAGTIACRVKDAEGNVYALSNNHVYADVNNASIGDNVLQPGAIDGGVDPDDAIGMLADFEPIKFAKRRKIPENTIDAAIALSSTANLSTATPEIGGYGTPNSTIVAALLGQQVQKFGRTTELTNGEITGVNTTVDVGYGPGKTARFVKQIIVESEIVFILGGDSGSLLVTDNADLNPVGLLFAGTSDGLLAVANRINLVLDRFNVSVDGEAPPPPTTGSIGGTVTDASGGTAIAGATISLDTGESTTTHDNGSYTIIDVPTGGRSVTASADGFESQTQPATVDEDQITTVNFTLSEAPAAPTLSVYVTTDEDSYVNREKVKITVTVTDGTNPVEGAAVRVEITTANKRLGLAADGNTNIEGVANFTYKVNSGRDGEGTYTVEARASKDGFNSGSDSTTFEVTK